MRLDAALKLGFSSSSCEPDGSDFKIEGRKPTLEELASIDAKAIELQTEYDSQVEDRALKAEYMKKTPYEQIEMLGDNTYHAWKAEIQNRIRSGK